MSSNCPTFVSVALDESIELSKQSLRKRGPVSEAIEELLSANTRLVSVEHDEGWRALLQFDSVTSALTAAGDFARRLIAARRGGLPVRIGVATGEASPQDGSDDVVVQRAKWLANVAPKSGILVSRTTAALGQDIDIFPYWLVKHGDLFNIGQYRTEYVWALRHKELPELPGLPEEDEPRHNIPDVEGHFLGRELEIDDVSAAINNYRWVTLVGPSGIGKSMLSWRVAHEVAGSMRDGVRYVDLSGVRNHDEAIGRLFESIGLQIDRIKPTQSTIRFYFGNRHHLILLDGCERCLADLEKIVKPLIATRGVRILATSTTPFDHSDEVQIKVEPFNVPPVEHHYSLDDLEGFDATALFLDRYNAIRPNFRPTAEQLSQIAQICQELDGHPLGINLAVSMLRNQSFSNVLSLVRQGVSGENKSRKRRRHENLDAAVRWTVESLEPESCKLLEFASVFDGLWSREDMKEMMECEMGDLAKPLRDVLQSGLAIFDQEATPPESFRLLPHVRHAMRDSMRSRKEWQKIRERHFLRIYEKFRQRLPNIKGADSATHLDRLDAMRTDFESALRYLIETETSQDSFLMAMSQCWNYWYRRNRLTPIITLAEEARVKCKPDEVLSRARLDMLAAIFETKAGDSNSAQKRLRRALKTIENFDHPQTKYQILTNLGLSLWAEAEPHKARKILEEAVRIARTTENQALIYPAIVTSVPPLIELGEFEQAWERLNEIGDIARASQDPLIHWAHWLGLAEYFCETKRYPEAIEAVDKSIESARTIGDPSSVGRSYLWRSQILLRIENFPESAENMGRCLYMLSDGEQALYTTNLQRIMNIEKHLRDEMEESQINLQKMFGALQSQLDTGKM